MILRGVKFAFKLLRDLVEEFGRDRRLYLRGRHFTILPACHMPSASIPDLEGRETGYEQDGANPPWSRERAFDRLWRLIPSLTAAGNAAAPQIENRSTDLLKGRAVQLLNRWSQVHNWKHRAEDWDSFQD